MPEGLRVILGRSHKKKEEKVRLPPANIAGLSDELKASLPPEVAERAENDLRTLLNLKVLSQCDLEIFERYCQHLRLAYEADAILRREGVMALDENGVRRKHPAVQIHRDSSGMALKFAAELGLTPSARMRINKTETQKQGDDYADFRGRHSA
jgi:P27 family predicted phage terminase small subunit